MAMLGKQFWRLIEKPNAFSQVFKGRYFRNTSHLEPVRSYSLSYGWCSIVSTRSLVSKKTNQKGRIRIIYFSMKWSLVPNHSPETSKHKSTQHLPWSYRGFSHQCKFANMEFTSKSVFGGYPGCEDYRKYTIEPDSGSLQRWMEFHQ